MIKNPNQTNAQSIVAIDLQKEADLAEKLAQAEAKRKGLRKRPEDEALAVDGQPIPEHAHGASDALIDPLAADDSLVPLGTATTDPYAYIQNEILAHNDVWATDSFDPIQVAQGAPGSGGAAGGGAAGGGAAGGGGGGAAAGGGAAGGGAAGGAAAGGAAGGAAAGGAAAGAAGGGFVAGGIGVAGGVAVGAGAAVAAGAGGGSDGPSTPPTISNFRDYLTLAPVQAGDELTLVASSYSGGTQQAHIFGGFDREQLPRSYADLAPIAQYDVTSTGPSGSSSSSDAVLDRGLRINLASDANMEVYVTASAGTADTSDLIWMRNLGIYEQATGEDAGSADAYIEVNAVASGVVGEDSLPSDAEVGIGNLGIHLRGTGDLHGSIAVYATAQNGTTSAFAQANVQIDNLTVEVSNENTPSSFGDAHAYLSLYAQAWTAADAQISVFHDVVVAAHAASAGEGSLATAELNGVFAHANGNYAATSTYSGTWNSSANARVIVDGSINVSASGTSAAQAYIDYITADADNNAYAGISVGGDVTVQASGSAYGLAYISDIAAIASNGSGSSAVASAEVVIDGNVVVNAGGRDGGTATAYIDYITAYARSSASARVQLAQDVTVHAEGTDDVLAYIQEISASAYSSASGQASAQIVIDGSVRVSAEGATASSDNATAYVNTIQAWANNTNAEAYVRIGGDVSVNADAIGEDAGWASAYIGRISAQTGSSGAVASVSVAGDVSVTAQGGDSGAAAFMRSIYVNADLGTVSTYSGTIGGTASVNIDGNVLVSASASDGDANGYLDYIQAYAYQGNGRIQIDGDEGVVVRAHATGMDITPTPVHTYTGATQSTFYAEDGKNANAFISAISATAYSEASADIAIAGSVRVSASAASGSASAHLNYIEANHVNSEPGAEAHVSIGGDVNVYAAAHGLEQPGFTVTGFTYSGNAITSPYYEGHDASARLWEVTATATAEGIGSVDIAGSINVSAYASSGEAQAYLGTLKAEADYTNALAYVSVGGDVNVHAEGDNIARAGLQSIYADASYGATTYSGYTSGASALVSIGGDVTVRATAYAHDSIVGEDTYAMGYVDYIAANAYYSAAEAHVAIDGAVRVEAQGYGHWTSDYAIPAGSNPVVQLQQGVDALAYVGSISASAYNENSATVTIGSSGLEGAPAIAISAYASQGSAEAYLGGISANAYYTSGEAHVVVNGDVSVHASANGAHQEVNYWTSLSAVTSTDIYSVGNQAMAYLGDITASAYSESNASADVRINGDVDVRANADGSALAYVGTVSAYAGSDYANANVSIAGDVRVQGNAGFAYGEDQQNDAGAYLHQIYANASYGATYSGVESSSAGAQANVSIGGNVDVSAYAPDGSASAYIDYIGAQAYYSGADALVMVGGSIHVSATAVGQYVDQVTVYTNSSDVQATEFLDSGNDARAYIRTISASAYTSDQAAVLIGGFGFGEDSGPAVDVSAYATDGSASAYLNNVNAYAWEPNGIAGVVVNGGIDVQATAFGRHDEYHGFGYTSSGTNYSYSIDRDVGNDAAAHLGGIHVYASMNTSDTGGIGAVVGVNGSINVSAYAGTGSASAYVGDIDVYAQGSDAFGVVSILGDVNVTARAGGDHATAAIVSIAAAASYGATYSGHAASTYSGNFTDNASATVAIDGHLHVYADAWNGSASAYIDYIGAYAYADAAEAHVSIAGDVSVQADASGTHSTTAFGLSANYSTTQSFNISVGNDVNASISLIGATAYADNNSATVTLGDSMGDALLISAYAATGDAWAYLGYVEANAYDAGGHAQVDIYGDVAVVANASGYGQGLDLLGYTSSSTFAAGIYEVTTQANQASAILRGISASATTDSFAGVNVYGDVTVRADSDDGRAMAYMREISASASGTNAEAVVSIVGDVRVEAYGGTGSGEDDTSAGLYSIYANASYGVATYSGIDGMTYSGNFVSAPVAAVSIFGDVSIGASATNGSASAYLDYIVAEARNEGAYATVSIQGNVSVNAHASGNHDETSYVFNPYHGSHGTTTATGYVINAGNNATADIGTIGATAYEGDARVDIGNFSSSAAIAVSASAESGSASATLSYIQAEAGNQAVANVSIHGDVQVHAVAAGTNEDLTWVYSGSSAISTAVLIDGNDAYAEIWAIKATADAGDEQASAYVNIDGDVSVIATATAGSATAYLDYVQAYALDTGASASVTIGDISIQAHGEDYARAMLDSIDARAVFGNTSGNGADADVRVGAVQVTADASSGSAYAYVEYVGAYAQGSSTDARVDVFGDMSVNAFARAYTYTTPSATFTTGSNATAYISLIGATAGTFSGEFGSASVYMLGDVNVHASAEAADASAYIASIHADAESFGSDARIQIGIGYSSSSSVGGDVTVSAIGAGDVDAYIGYISAYASDDGNASISIVGDIHVTAGAPASSTSAVQALSAYAWISGISASAYSTGTANVSIGGDVVLEANAIDYATNYLVVSADTGQGSTSASAYATVNIEGNIMMQAAATNDDAGIDAFSQLRISAQGHGVVNVGSQAPSFALAGPSGEVHMQVTATAGTASAYLQVIAVDSASVNVGNIYLTVDAEQQSVAGLDIYASDDANVSVGDINLTVHGGLGSIQIARDLASTATFTAGWTHTASSTAEIDIGNVHINVSGSAAASLYVNNLDFTSSGYVTDGGDAGVAWDSARVATLSGAGDVYMEITNQVFGMINGGNATLGTFSGHLELNMWGEHDDTLAADVQYTTLRGFNSGGHLQHVSFEFSSHDATASFTSITSLRPDGKYVNQQQMFDDMDANLEGGGGDVYAFAVFDEAASNIDINADGVKSANLGVIGFDGDGDGLSGVLYLPGVNTLNATDLGLITLP